MTTFNLKVYNDFDIDNVKTATLQVGTLTYPNVDGTTGQVLGTDGNGHLLFITNGDGDVSGPASSIDNSIALFSGTTGKLLKDSLGSIDNTGKLTTPSLVSSGLSYPTSDGTNGQVISTDGFGGLSFSNGPGILGPASSIDISLARWDGTFGKVLTDSPTYLDNLGHLIVPYLSVGTVLFPSVDGTSGQVLTTDGVGSASWQSVPGCLIGLQDSSIALNISAGDHIQFNKVLGSNGLSISLDISSPYSNVANVASIGRITLQQGHTYALSGTIQGVTFLLATGSITTEWWDADSDVAVSNGTGSSILGTLGLGGVNSPTAIAVVTPPGVATRYELRITSAISLVSTGITVLNVEQLV